jgi:shikimate kinase
VYATGGGLPIYNNLMDVLKANGLVLTLDISIEEILRRMQKNDGDRPLLQGNKAKQLTELYEKRNPVYQQAHGLVKYTDPKQDAAKLKTILTR